MTQEAENTPGSETQPADAPATEPATTLAPPSRRSFQEVVGEYPPDEIRQALSEHPVWKAREGELHTKWAQDYKKEIDQQKLQEFLTRGDPAEVGRWLQNQEAFKTQKQEAAAEIGQFYGSQISGAYEDLFKAAAAHLKALPMEQKVALNNAFVDVWKQDGLGIEKGAPIFHRHFLTALETAIRADERIKAQKDFETEKVALRTSWEAEANGERQNPDISRGRGSVGTGLSIQEVLSWTSLRRREWEAEHPEEAKKVYAGVLGS